MVIGPAPICLQCKHYDKSEDRETIRCDAFPDGIPDEILYTGFIHTNPYPGDNGIRFEPIE